MHCIFSIYIGYRDEYGMVPILEKVIVQNKKYIYKQIITIKNSKVCSNDAHIGFVKT